MKESNKNTIVLTIITIAVFLVAVLGATYAYFATEKNIGSSINANVGTAASMYSFSASSNDRIEMNIGYNQMSEANVSTEKIASDNATLNVSLASPKDDMLTTCTYDIVWVWDSENTYTTPDGGTLPINKDGQTYNYEFSTMIDGQNETDISNLEANNSKLILKKGASIRSTSTTPITKAYDISTNVYNLPIDQTKLFGKNFSAHITVENLNCKIYDAASTKDLATYIAQDVYTADGDNDLYYHDGNGSYTNANLEAGDNSYRYAGANPNNYICFKEGCTDAEKFRIIGVTDNKVKVIKYKHAGYKKWNEKAGYTAKTGDEGLTAGKTYTNIWAIKQTDDTYYTSSLNDYLNSEYLSILGNASDLIDVTTWHTGGLSGSERSNNNAQGIFNIETRSNPTVDSKIALMYVSDYMYAAAPTYWSLTGYNSKDATKDYRASLGNDWIYVSDFPMSISRLTDFIDRIWLIKSDGHVEAAVATGSNVIHPTFNLIPNAKIVNINDANVGSKEVPMIIA